MKLSNLRVRLSAFILGVDPEEVLDRLDLSHLRPPKKYVPTGQAIVCCIGDYTLKKNGFKGERILGNWLKFEDGKLANCPEHEAQAIVVGVEDGFMRIRML